MTAIEILARCDAEGVELQVTPQGNIRWRSRGPLPEWLREEIVYHKPALLALLTAKPGELSWPRLIEIDQGLPAGSIGFLGNARPSCPGCAFCLPDRTGGN